MGRWLNLQLEISLLPYSYLARLLEPWFNTGTSISTNTDQAQHVHIQFYLWKSQNQILIAAQMVEISTKVICRSIHLLALELDRPNKRTQIYYFCRPK
jgi:hypothetical protein